MPGDKKSEARSLSDLLGAVAAEDRSAFAPLYEAISAKLFGVTLRILRNRQQAEEVLQEVYIRIWRRAVDYRPEKGTPMTWMITIARHRALDRRRQQKPELPLDEADGYGETAARRLSRRIGSRATRLHNPRLSGGLYPCGARDPFRHPARHG